LQQVSEDYALRAKRQTLQEDTLTKRLLVHEKNARELADRVRAAEERHAQEVDMVRRELEQRVVEVAGERDSIREKVNNVEK
jgi:rubrerythrin